MKYHVSYNQPSRHYIDIVCTIENVSENRLNLQFPTWRPGRYELGNFAKNIQYFKVFDGDGNALKFDKVKKDAWEVDTSGVQTVVVEYNYYAFELNAGSTYLDEKQLYINPVNCFVYVKDRQEVTCTVSLDIPSNYKVAAGIPFKNNVLEVASYHALVDNPFIASPSIQHFSFNCKAVDFHLWFQGEAKIDWPKVKGDFLRYTESQIEAYGEFPVQEYHYLFQITPYSTYHGVEHLNSTVIALGPSYDLMHSRYPDLLGVSSHELYHTWNIKSIRPSEMHPYDYSQENYSKMGYVAEGVTTYLGDLFLLQSGVFTIDDYCRELTAQFQKHFTNDGRFNYSVAQSSYDTWLDGYQAGVPGRKVSIYTEGCLLAFVLDTMIMRANENKSCIHDVMYVLYHRYAKEGLPYTEEIYKSAIEEVSNLDTTEYFERYINGTSTYEGILLEALDYVGLEMIKAENPIISQRDFGMKLRDCKIVSLADGSPAHMAGLSSGDTIMAINDLAVNNDVDKWLNYFHEDVKILTINRNGEIIKKVMPQIGLTFMKVHSVKKLEETTHPQREAFNRWSRKKK